MDQIVFFYFVLLTLVGVVLTAVLIFFSFQRNNRLVDALALFFGFYTLNVSLDIFDKYLILSLPGLYVVFFDLVVVLNLFGRAVFLWSVLFLLIQLAAFRFSKIMLAVHSILLAIAAVLPGMFNNTPGSLIAETQLHKIDLLDIIGILLFVFAFVVLLRTRKSVSQVDKRLLVNGVILILGVSFPLIALDLFHLLPRFIPLNSLVFLLFALLLTTLLLKSKGFKSCDSKIPSIPTTPSGLEDLDLTAREKEVLALLIKERSDKEIAGELHITVASVKKHIRNIFKKMAVKNRWELVSNYKNSPDS